MTVVDFRAISVRQPFANYIACGEKTIEFRSWTTRYRGPLVIVSSAKPSDDPEYQAAWKEMRHVAPLGVTIALVDLITIVPFKRQHRELAMLYGVPMTQLVGFAWILRDVQPLQPQPISGKLSIFTIGAEKVRVAA